MKNTLVDLIKKHKFTLLSLVVALGMYGVVSVVYTPAHPVQQMAQVVAGQGRGTPAIGGDFTMTDDTGQPFTEADLLGKYHLIFFGFTFCPDICPTTLSMIDTVYQTLPEELQQNLQPVMVSVDPERDTVPVLHHYVHAFGDYFIGLTGTPEQLATMAQAYKVYYAKSGEGEDYTVAHSGYLYLMGPDGRYITHFSHKDTVADMQAKLVQLMSK